MIIAANLKTNFTRQKTVDYVAQLEKYIKENEITQKVFVFPAMSSLYHHTNSAVTLGAQNAYPTYNGAFTGEIGDEQLQEFEIKTLLIGHSERRHILGETQEMIIKKFNYYKELGFEIVYCVGEPLEVRKQGQEATLEYIEQQYKGIDTTYEKLIIAYEPVWAIGTGLTPTMQDIASIHTALKAKSSAPLLYGGSVKVNNAKEILSIENVDGILVGSAALNKDDFIQMIEFAQKG
ncbi:Triosephosphate isomerase [hydrothermal vent metagenome]|uniref:Triosephosphate isomerase n=1 Tax=hydrothermal vent metagenome TaxID=652676 RepID=A0A1W1D2V8_9ZZZZ